MSTPTITQQTVPNSEKIGITKSYPLSIAGLLRLGIILFQLAALISAASIPKLFNGQTYIPPDMNSTRDAYLFFSITGFIIAIFIYVVRFFNVTSLEIFSKIPFNLIIMFTDFLWLLPTFILAIVCAVKEGAIRDPFYLYSKFFNRGAFASASVFGFLNAILYAVDGAFHLIKQKRG